MRAMVNGVMYDTETAQSVVTVTFQLFRTQKGSWFVLDKMGVRPISSDDAMRLVADNCPEQFEKFFPVEMA